MSNKLDKFEVNRKLNSYLVDNGIRKTWLARQTGIKYKRIIDITKKNYKVNVIELQVICNVLNKDINFFTK